MASQQYQTVTEYINSFDGKIHEYLLEMRTLIFRAVPIAEELINYNIASYALIEGGKREEQIMVAGCKNHIGFYPHPTTIAHFLDRLSNYKTAKGSIQFKLNEPLPEKLIIEMVTWKKNEILKAL
ncbi:MAG: DUF1801 domain-containing protein [Bacteroidota bacterium]